MTITTMFAAERSEFCQRVLDDVQAKSVKLVSFDIFDTLVHRKTSLPVDVFATAWNQAQDSLNLTMTAAEYTELRVSTEQRVKRHSANGEVTLEAIIQGLPFSESIKTILLDAELAAEKALGFIDQQMVGLIEALMAQQVKVVFISDMYLSALQIRQCYFGEYGFLCDIPLYVSSELQVNKATGTVFRVVQQHTNASPDNWLHIGDHPVSDQEMPGRAGIHTALVKGRLNQTEIIRQEAALFAGNLPANAARLIASSHYKGEYSTDAFSLATFVWGPIMYAFADWVIDQSLKAGSRSILCLMREAEVFEPVISLRVKQRNIQQLSVKKLYASRKSTFWPAIDINDPQWFEDLIYVLVQRRGYSVQDFYRDFCLTEDELHRNYKEAAIRDTDGMFCDGMNLLKLLVEKARANQSAVASHIEQQKRRFINYYTHHIGIDLSECSVVDLGNGGTIPHHIECILNSTAKLNLLFYSSERIYRYAERSCFSSFINAGTDTHNLRQLLSRSPECIEPFLVGDCGTVTGYSDDETGTPEQAEHLPVNSAPVRDFLSGLIRYFQVHNQYQLAPLSAATVMPLLYRYLQLPTQREAMLFTQLEHQDNFGSNDAYPIITTGQCSEVAAWPLDAFYQEFCQYPKIKVGKIHWPQAVITLIDEKFLSRQHGLQSMNTDADAINLLDRILQQQWQSFAVYGAGLFFEKLLPLLQKNNLQVEQLIDRKAEISGNYEVAGFQVIPLQQALEKGCNRILISSFAFKEEIARNIYEQTLARNMPGVEVLSL